MLLRIVPSCFVVVQQFQLGPAAPLRLLQGVCTHHVCSKQEGDGKRQSRVSSTRFSMFASG